MILKKKMKSNLLELVIIPFIQPNQFGKANSKNSKLVIIALKSSLIFAEALRSAIINPEDSSL